MSEKVAILGASDKPERYSYKAFKMLQEYGHEPFPVSPSIKTLEGVEVSPDLSQLSGIDTVTVYVNPKVSSLAKDEIIRLHPKRVIFNPGAENPELAGELKKVGIDPIEDCTLVLLRTAQF